MVAATNGIFSDIEFVPCDSKIMREQIPVCGYSHSPQSSTIHIGSSKLTVTRNLGFPFCNKRYCCLSPLLEQIGHCLLLLKLQVSAGFSHPNISADNMSVSYKSVRPLVIGELGIRVDPYYLMFLLLYVWLMSSEKEEGRQEEGEGQENEEDNNDNILAKEVESWKGFEYALKQQNASLFNKMLSECLENEEYASVFKSRGPQNSAESLFMALIFQQRKMISKLIE